MFVKKCHFFLVFLNQISYICDQKKKIRTNSLFNIKEKKTQK